MKTKIINEFNLKDTDIDEIVTRVKAFIINSKNEILLAVNGGSYQLPGGHLEENESYKTTIIREVCEETGITIEENEIDTPFYKISRYTPNHRGTGKNRLSEMIYFQINTDKKPDISKISLTDNEKENNFHLINISSDNFADILREYISHQEEGSLNEIIANETLDAFLILQQINKNFTI